jgi:hypothetical protein
MCRAEINLEAMVYRINWHIVPPYVARVAEMPSLRGYFSKMYLLYKMVCAPYKLCIDPPLGAYYIPGRTISKGGTIC